MRQSKERKNKVEIEVPVHYINRIEINLLENYKMNFKIQILNVQYHPLLATKLKLVSFNQQISLFKNQVCSILFPLLYINVSRLE